MRLENEELKARGTGDFRDETARKRGREEAEATPANIWTEFEQEIRGGRTFGTAL